MKNLGWGFFDVKLKPSGFSLIELIVVIGLLGLVGVLSVAVYFGNFKLFKTQEAEIEVSAQNRVTLDEILNTIRQTANVEASYTDGSTTFTSETTTPLNDTNTIVLKIPSIDSSNEIIVNEYDTVIYQLDLSSGLVLKVFPSSCSCSNRIAVNKPFSTIVSDIDFSYNDPDFANVSLVTVTITTEKTVFGRNKNITVSGEAQLRNF